jgi:hypothetical protein
MYSRFKLEPALGPVHFTGKLFKTEGEEAWTFGMLPLELAPPVTCG